MHVLIEEIQVFAFTPFDLFFYVIAIATIASAFWVLTSRNIIHAAIGLLFTLFGVGGLYLMLASDFLGFLQLFVYIGATMVLIMFGIMLTRREEKGGDDKVSLSQRLATRASSVLGLFVAGAVFAFLFVILIVSGSEQWEKSAAESIEPPTHMLGEKLLTEYVYAFEIISVFLMVGLVGAAYLARRRDVTVEKKKPVIIAQDVEKPKKEEPKAEVEEKLDDSEKTDESEDETSEENKDAENNEAKDEDSENEDDADEEDK